MLKNKRVLSEYKACLRRDWFSSFLKHLEDEQLCSVHVLFVCQVIPVLRLLTDGLSFLSFFYTSLRTQMTS